MLKLLLIGSGLTGMLLGSTTYYVDNCVTVGSDANNGTSPATPWLTISHVNSATFAVGDSILFQRTCSWREQLIPPSSGSAGNPITFGAYGSGVKPVLDGSTLISSGSWVLQSGSIYHTPLAWGPFGYDVFQDGTTVLVGAASLGAMVAGTFFESGTTLYVWTTNSTVPSGHTIEVSHLSGQNDGLIEIIGKNYITIDNLDIKKSNWIGVYLRTTSNIKIQNSSFEYTYWNAISEDEQAGAGDAWLYGNSDHVSVLSNSFTNCGQSRLATNHNQEGVAIQGLGWQTATISGNTVSSNLGEGIVAMGGGRGISITKNLVTNTNYAGIFVLGGPHGGDTTLTTIQYNYVQNVPNATPAYVIAPEGSTGDNTDGVNFSYNVAYCNNSGAYYALRIGGSGGTGVWKNISAYNNTLVCPYGITISTNGPSGPGNDFENNIIYSTSFQTFITSDTASSNYTIGYEDIFSPLSGLIQWSNGTNYTLAAFRAAFPAFFGNSVSADPKFNNLAGDFTLQGTSPAIGIGKNLCGPYNMALDPASLWPSAVSSKAQNPSWDMGAFYF